MDRSRSGVVLDLASFEDLEAVDEVLVLERTGPAIEA